MAKAKDLLAGLSGKKTPAKTDNRASRPNMELPPALEATFRRFIGAWAVAEQAEKRRDQEQETLDEGCFLMWTDTLWKTKNRPANPSMKNDKEGMAAIFQVQERYSLNKPEVSEGKTLAEVLIQTFIDLFSATGMDDNEAEVAATRLVNSEFDMTPKKSVDFIRLAMGHYEGEGKNKTWVEASEAEQAIAIKIITLLQARTLEDIEAENLLTDDEASQAVEEKDSVVIRKGFLNRVCGYVKSLDQLRTIFKIIKPVKFPSHVKFAENTTPEEKAHRLLEEAKDIFGMTGK